MNNKKKRNMVIANFFLLWISSGHTAISDTIDDDNDWGKNFMAQEDDYPKPMIQKKIPVVTKLPIQPAEIHQKKILPENKKEKNTQEVSKKDKKMVQAIVSMGKEFYVWIDGKLFELGDYCSFGNFTIASISNNRVEVYYGKNNDYSFHAYVGEFLPLSTEKNEIKNKFL